MVLEYVRGRSLKAVLSKDGPLAAERVVSIARQVLEALAEAHARGIVHRDLKPDNVMVLSAPFGSEKVKVLDFGIAKVVHGEHGGSDTVETKRGMALGTPRYMAPEQAIGKVSARSDLYSLGVVMYELLSGQPPSRLTRAPRFRSCPLSWACQTRSGA